MSYLYDNPDDQARLSDTLDRLPSTPETPGLFGNFWSATGSGFARGALKLGQLGTFYQDPDAAIGQQMASAYAGRDLVKEDLEARAAARKMLAQKAQELTPNPLITGTASKIASGFAEILPTAVGGGMVGGPLAAAGLVGGSQGVGQFEESRLQGIDARTAAGLGAVTGLTAGLGVVVPMSKVGAGLITNMGIGAGVNLGLGGVMRGSTAAILEAGGYKDQAAQYRVLDGEAMLIDTILGAGFGAVGHAMGRPSQAQIDAALRLNERQHVEVSGQPGIHNTPESRQQGVAAFEETLQGLLDDGTTPDLTTRAAAMDLSPNPAHQQLQREVGQVVNDWVGNVGERLPVELPGAVLGNESAVKIAGEYVPTQWALVDADTVGATLNKAENQFRDRTRAASEIQINRIASDPDFNLLGHSPIMDFGAPTLTRDGRIVGGNGRFAGVSRSYDIGTGERYAGPLRENLERFGIDPKAAEGMKKPVLVRVLQSDVDVARAAIASNEGAGLRMSALEQAKVDSERLGDLAGLEVGETGELNNPANRGHIREWIAKFPTEEAAGLVDKAGKLSAEGAVRLRNAVLFRAYGDSPTLARLVESTDPGARNVATALLRTAAVVAEAKAAIADGRLYPLDISTDIAAAIETLDSLRTEGMKVAEFLAQGEMFGSGLTPEARRILQFFGENMRSAKAMSELISRYYEKLRAVGDPNQGSMFERAEPTRGELLEAALTDTGRDIGAAVPELRAQEAPAQAEPVMPARPGPERLAELLPAEQLARLPAAVHEALRDVYARAEQAKAGFDQIAGDIARLLGGEYMAAPLKGARRAIDKIIQDYKGDPNKIKDVLRSSIIVPDGATARQAIAELRARFDVMDSGFRDLFDPQVMPMDGYRDAKMNVRINGIAAEIQVHIPEMIEAKAKVHDLYEARSQVERASEGRQRTPEEQARIDELNAQMRAIYEPAWERATSSLNRGSETGAPLRLADSAENARGGSSSQAAQENGTPGTLPSDTGMPSTSNSSTDRGTLGNSINTTSESSVSGRPGVVKNATGDVAPIYAEQARQLLDQHPDLTLPGEDGQPVLLRDLLTRADEDIAAARRDSDLYDVAVACFLGSGE